jgi:broad specificity phosphatase PhoE
VGLPARGKSFLSRKLLNYLTWRGNQCRIFNVGKYRREAASQLAHESHDHFIDRDGTRQKMGACDANFFDDSNQQAAKLRQRVAHLALMDALEWLENANGAVDSRDSTHSLRRQNQSVAIFDATNSTKQRRAWILQTCKERDEESGKSTGVVFVESICNDKELLVENMHHKISSCPDFDGVDRKEAMADLQQRVEKYESRYEPIDDDALSYIQIFNLSSKILVNHVYGRLAKVIVPAFMGWHTGSRPIYLCRAGETEAMQRYIMNNGEHSATREPQANTVKRMRGDSLGPRGLAFRDSLCDFIEQEGLDFMNQKLSKIHPRDMETGTSISGLLPDPNCDLDDDSSIPQFPCLVMSSTMPRALETASWRLEFPIKDVSNLNPLDMGDFAGIDLEEIKEQHPEWYEQLERDPFHTRFPGGESYSDLINRLESVVVDVEQQLGPAVVVSHVSVLQVLVAYFRSTPIAQCTSIEVPMHTVFKFVPLRGGGWLESHHKLLPDDLVTQFCQESPSPMKQPIWGDSHSCLPQKLNRAYSLPSFESR